LLAKTLASNMVAPIISCTFLSKNTKREVISWPFLSIDFLSVFHNMCHTITTYQFLNKYFDPRKKRMIGLMLRTELPFQKIVEAECVT